MYNPKIHHRRSIRLKNYDYSQAGLYFVTICVQNRDCLFGHVVNDEMVLNDAGQMIEKWCLELSHKFPDIELDTFVIMPNHFHGIIVNTAVGAHLCVRPDKNPCTHDKNPCTHDENLCTHDENLCTHDEDKGEHDEDKGKHDEDKGEHVGSPLRAVIQWFKTMTTNEYIRGVKTLNWQPFEKKLWQRNYYEHIIRNNISLNRIADYIETNPSKWMNDELYTE